MQNMGGDLSAALEGLADFIDELPTLQCGEDGCNSCAAAFHAACATLVPGNREETWEEPTKPDLYPAFMKGYDDDYIIDPELGGEG